MFLPAAALSLLLLHRVAASPLRLPPSTRAESAAATYDWTNGTVISYPIHESCNVTLRRQLERALDETVELVRHAKEHLLLRGHDSPFVTKYFGNSSTATAIGWYERVAAANKIDMLFRCDDPDRNCATQDGNATPSPPFLHLGLRCKVQ